MKHLMSAGLMFLAQNALAGSLFVQVDGTSSGFGSELKYFSLEDRSGTKYLYLQSKSDDSCRVPVQMLKNLGIDPLQAGNLLLNSGSAAPIFECRMTKEQLGKTRVAHDISFTSFPKQ